MLVCCLPRQVSLCDESLSWLHHFAKHQTRLNHRLFTSFVYSCKVSECMRNSCFLHISTEVDNRLWAIFWGTRHQRIFWWWQGAFFPARWSSSRNMLKPKTCWPVGMQDFRQQFLIQSTLLAKLHVDHVVRVPHPIRLCALGLLFYKSKQTRGWIRLDSSMSSRLNMIMCAGGSSALYSRLRMLQNLCTV